MLDIVFYVPPLEKMKTRLFGNLLSLGLLVPFVPERLWRLKSKH